MHVIDISVLAAYFVGMLVLGAAVMRKQDTAESFFVGDRKMGTGHIGFSVVATDVGGGFSIGLGGLGFSMGVSGSWLLFTGLIGAWLTAVVLIPRIKPLGDRFRWTTFPEYLEYRYDRSGASVPVVLISAFADEELRAQARRAGVFAVVEKPFEIDELLAVVDHACAGSPPSRGVSRSGVVGS